MARATHSMVRRSNPTTIEPNLPVNDIGLNEHHLHERIVLKRSDMPSELEHIILVLAQQCYRRHWRFNDMARHIRNELEKYDKEYGNWHVIVGTRFAGSNTYQKNRMIYFYIKQTGFLIFKY